MRSKGYGEHHQNNNLKVIITFSNFINPPFMTLIKQNKFLNQKVKR